jgi:hypothetical protein
MICSAFQDSMDSYILLVDFVTQAFDIFICRRQIQRNFSGILEAFTGAVVDPIMLEASDLVQHDVLLVFGSIINASS